MEEKVRLADIEKMDLDKIQEVLKDVNFAAGKQAEESFKTIMTGVLQKGIMPKTALKLGDDTMEAIYTQAYNLYNQGRYKEASYIFRLLMLLDFTTPKYILGLAACLHRSKDYLNAANLYLLTAALDVKNPMPHYHAADCYLQMNAFDMAALSLQMAIDAAGEQPQYAVIKQRATLMKASIQLQKLEFQKKMQEEAEKQYEKQRQSVEGEPEQK